jgi:4-amino-4-deoxy-L-arabinose transferase-like glycosyltransferase
MLGLRALPGVLALLAFSPLQIHLAQHALIDGVFTFWAILSLWLLWENLQRPDSPRLLAAFGVSLACMVVTKENSFFVYLALGGLIATNRWAKFGTVTPRLLITTIVAPALGVVALVLLAGGLAPFVEIYRLLVTKAQNLTYAIRTGDGPWYRYLVDLLLLSPLVLILALGGLFTQVRGSRAFVYLLAFIGFTYLVMCNVRYGMNLRYASIWDLPLRALAAAQVGALMGRFGKKQTFLTSIAIVGLCAYDLRQYQIFFVDCPLYELVTEGLLRAVKILK